jgi:hypothetical protein
MLSGVWSAPGANANAPGETPKSVPGSAALVFRAFHERWREEASGVFRKTRRVRPAESGGRTCEGEQRAGARHGAVGVGEREVQRLCAWEDGGGDPSVSRRCAIGGG